MLSLFAIIIQRMKGSMAAQVPLIFSAVFECTLEMITANFEDHPDHRLRFFALLHAIANHCFACLLQMSAQQQRLLIDSIVWAFRHTERNVAETGLALLADLLARFVEQPVRRRGRRGGLELRAGRQAAQWRKSPRSLLALEAPLRSCTHTRGTQQSPHDPRACAQDHMGPFFKAHYLTLVREVFAVMTDTMHKPGFKAQARILAALLRVAKGGALPVPLWDAAAEGAGAYQSNAAFVRVRLSRAGRGLSRLLRDGLGCCAAARTSCVGAQPAVSRPHSLCAYPAATPNALLAPFQSHLIQLLATSFPNLTPPQVESIVASLFAAVDDAPAFKTVLRDFLVQTKEFGQGDNAELFGEERAAADAARAAAVPGLLPPHAVRDDGMDA